MTKHGYIPEEWIVSYAAGALSEAHALMVATHAGYHPELTEKIGFAENIGGALLESNGPAPMKKSALEDVLARLDAEGEHDSDTAVSAPAMGFKNTDTDVPVCLREYLGKNLTDLTWRTMGPGMKQVKLAKGEQGETLWLLRAKGGTVIPPHDHRGGEFTLVLRGSYRVGDKHFTPGQIEVADESMMDHQPVINDGEECICLVVTEAPIRLHSFVGRMIQPLIGL